MLNEFRKFVGFKILEYFILHPTEKTYLQELAKKLNISPGSVNNYCNIFEKDGLIKREKKGNMHIFSTNNENFKIIELKKALFINLLGELNIHKVANESTSIAIYGSHASGKFDERSDIDLLIIGKEKMVNKDLIIKIMKKIGKEIQLNVLSMTNWEKMKKEGDAFVKSVIKNHILIKGVEL